MSRLARVAACGLLLALGPAVSPASAADVGGTWLGVPVWLWLSINLLLFLGALLYFLGPPIIRYLEARAEEIRRQLEEAKERRHEARTMQETLAEKIEGLRMEAKELLERAEEEGRKDREEILKQADEDRQRLLTQTREELDHRLAQARRQLTVHAASLAAELARARLEEELTDEDRRRLFEESLARLEKRA